MICDYNRHLQAFSGCLRVSHLLPYHALFHLSLLVTQSGWTVCDPWIVTNSKLSLITTQEANERDQLLRQGKLLYSENQLTEKTAA